MRCCCAAVVRHICIYSGIAAECDTVHPQQVMRPRKKGPAVSGFVMRRPGALHHARFMHHGLYLLKMALLADTIAFTTTEERGQVEHMAEFIALFHGPLFLQASLAAAAPRLDLQLWQHMEAYGLTEPVVAKATKDSLMRHLWYLAQKLVILGLFDPDVSD